MRIERTPLLLEMDRGLRRAERDATSGDPEAAEAAHRRKLRAVDTTIKKKRPVMGRGHTARSVLHDGSVLYSSSVAHDGRWVVHHGAEHPKTGEISDHGHETIKQYKYDGSRIVDKEPPHPDAVHDSHRGYIDRYLRGEHS